MAAMGLSNYKTLYLQTAKEYIGNMSSCFDKLANNSSDREALKSLHISSHSLKSQSQVMSFVDIASLCANIEKISKDILNEIRQVDAEFLALLKNSVDKLNLELAKIEK